MLQNPCYKRLLLCSKCTVYLKYSTNTTWLKFFPIMNCFSMPLKFTIVCKVGITCVTFVVFLFFMNKINMFLQLSDVGVPICHKCVKLATHFCKTCNHNLCKHCIINHYRNKYFTKDHEMLPL